MRTNHMGVIGNHAVVNIHTNEVLNLRSKGSVLSNKTAEFDRANVSLPQCILEVLDTTVPLYKILGIGKGEANAIQKKMEPPQYPVNALQALLCTYSESTKLL